MNRPRWVNEFSSPDNEEEDRVILSPSELTAKYDRDRSYDKWVHGFKRYKIRPRLMKVGIKVGISFLRKILHWFMPMKEKAGESVYQKDTHGYGYQITKILGKCSSCRSNVADTGGMKLRVVRCQKDCK